MILSGRASRPIGQQDARRHPRAGARGCGRSAATCKERGWGGAPVSDLPDVRRLKSLRAFDDLELHLVAFSQRPEALGDDRRVVDEHVLATVLRDKAEALGIVEPLDRAL